jgi:hypothetical protein
MATAMTVSAICGKRTIRKTARSRRLPGEGGRWLGESFGRLGKSIVNPSRLLQGLPLACMLWVLTSAQAEDRYPPPDSSKDGVVLEAPDGQFHVEEWRVNSGGTQTWLVSNDGKDARLPEIKLPDYGDSGSIGFPSEFHFSSDGKYLFRNQKVAHGTSGAYIYRRVAGLDYIPADPDLYIQADAYFKRLTGLSWYYDPPITEYAGWQADDSVAVTLRGLSADRQLSIVGWKCLFSPETGQFSLPKDWEAANKDAIRASNFPTPPPAVYTSKVASPDGRFAVAIGNQIAILNSAGAAVQEMDQSVSPETKVSAKWSPDSRHAVVVENFAFGDRVLGAWTDGSAWKLGIPFVKFSPLKGVKGLTFSSEAIGEWISSDAVRIHGVRRLSVQTSIPGKPGVTQAHLIPGPEGVAEQFVYALSFPADLTAPLKVTDLREDLRGTVAEAGPVGENSGLQAALDAADAQLNASYQQLRKRLDNAGREALKKDEVAWLRKRDRISDPQLKLRAIEERQQELQQLLNQLGQ